MDPKALLSKKNLLIAGGGSIILALGFVAYGIVTGDPTKDTREAYMTKTGQDPAPAREPVLEDLTGDLIEGEVVAVLPDGTTPTPTPMSGIPGVIDGGGTQVELTPVAPPMGTNVFTSFPPVPETLINPSLPGTERPDGSTNVRTITRIRADRWLFNNLAPTAVGSDALVLASKDPSAGLNPTTFSPMGETIQLALMENATSERVAISVMAAVWEPFYFQGNKLLDIGDKLIGRASPGKTRGRMVIKFDKVIFKDGRSLPIDAVAQDINGTYGVKGIQIGDVLLNSAGPLLLDTAASFFEVLQDVAKNATVVAGGGNTGLIIGAGQDNTAQNSVEAGTDGVKNVFDTISTLLSDDIVDNQPYILVPAGTRVQAFLLEPMDISKAGYGK